MGALLLALSAGLVAWAATRPSYDAYGWLVWGYQTLHGTLDLGGAPSWKPLPYVFTVPFALFGRAELWLWMLTAVALSLAGAIFAGRIAYRLTLVGSGGAALDGAAESGVAARRAAIVAAAFAAVALLGIEDYTHYILSVQSDSIIVACTLGAIDSHLSGRRRWAFAFALLASFGRPEAWPWLGLYSLWAWLRVPKMRLMIVAGLALLLFFWFGIPTITNGRPFVSAQLAMNSPRELHSNKLFGTIGRFKELHYWPVWIATLVCVVWAFLRRNRVVLALAAGSLGWVIVEIAFAFHGWPALPRYMMEPAGVCAVLGALTVGWAIKEAPQLKAGVPSWSGAVVAVLLAAALVPGALNRVRVEHRDLTHERHRATQISLMANAITALGGAHFVTHCAKPVANVEWVSALAWTVNMDVGNVGHLPQFELRTHHPILFFTPLTQGGWQMVPRHLHKHNYLQCRVLRSYYAIKPGHPDGVLIRY